MDEKTAELRDIFTSVTDEETVTESQAADRGSLEQDERSVENRLRAVVEQLKSRYAFETGLETDALVDVARAHYEGASDEGIATRLSDDGAVAVDAETVFEARMDLHLFEEDDLHGIDVATARRLSDDELVDEFELDDGAIRRCRRALAAMDESRAANDRYRDEFDSILADDDLAGRLATDVREDGLADATEGMETDVSF